MLLIHLQTSRVKILFRNVCLPQICESLQRDAPLLEKLFERLFTTHLCTFQLPHAVTGSNIPIVLNVASAVLTPVHKEFAIKNSCFPSLRLCLAIHRLPFRQDNYSCQAFFWIAGWHLNS